MELCTETTVPLNVGKTKKLTDTHFYISEGEVDQMNRFRFTENLSQLCVFELCLGIKEPKVVINEYKYDNI